MIRTLGNVSLRDWKIGCTVRAKNRGPHGSPCLTPCLDHDEVAVRDAPSTSSGLASLYINVARGSNGVAAVAIARSMDVLNLSLIHI